MRKAKLVENYMQLTFDAVSPLAHSVINQVTASAFLKDGAALLPALQQALAAYDEDVSTLAYPDPAQTVHRNALRAAVCTELGRLAKRLNLDYPANEAALRSSGLTMVNMDASNAARPLAPDTDIMDFDLADGSAPGCLLMRLKRPTGTIQNLIRYTTDPTLPEDQWHVAVGGGRERQLGPFPSGTRVYAKAAALTASTTEPVYSAVKSRIVQ